MAWKRWQAAKHVETAQDYYNGMQANADTNANALKPLTEAELRGIMNDPDFKLAKIGAGASEPYWAMLGGKRVGVVKTPSLGLEAEIAGPLLAEALRTPTAGARGVSINSPAAARAVMPIEWQSQGTFALYKGAGETASTAMGSGGDWRTIITSRNVSLTRASPDGPAVYWVMQNGRKAGLFMPDWAAESAAQGADTTLKEIARRSGGEVLGAVPDVEMTTPEVKCVFVRYVDGGTKPEPFTSMKFPGFPNPMCCSPDGNTLLVGVNDPNRPKLDQDIRKVSLGDKESSEPEFFIRRNLYQTQCVWSPDGRWIAYNSYESGSSEVYVEPYPGPGPKIPASRQGGHQPVWSRDGKELYYRRGSKVVALTVETEPKFKVLSSRDLSEGNYVDCLVCRTYDVAPDGRFLMIQDPQEPTPPQINVIFNWFDELKRLVTRPENR